MLLETNQSQVNIMGFLIISNIRGKFVRNRKIFEKIEDFLELHSEVNNLLWQKTKQILSELQY